MASVFDPNQLPMPDLGLTCRECGYPLAYLPGHRCPECGWSFTLDDLVPPGDFPPLYADGAEVRGTAEVLQLLREYQVPFISHLPPTEAVFGLVRTSRVGDPIGVPRERYLEVVDLLRRRRLGEQMPPAPVMTSRGAAWVCPGCGEENPANFQLCWNCERPLSD